MSQPAEVTGSGRGTLLLIVGIPLAMILGALFLMRGSAPQASDTTGA